VINLGGAQVVVAHMVVQPLDIGAIARIDLADGVLALISAIITPVTPPTMDISSIIWTRLARSSSLRGIWNTRWARSPVSVSYVITSDRSALRGHSPWRPPHRHAELRVAGDVLDPLSSQ